MILQALHAYYQRRQNDPDPARRLPEFGRESRDITFIVEVTAEGRLVNIKDTRVLVEKKPVASRYRVPQSVKKTSGIAANLLWDNTEYVFGVPDAKKLAEAERKGKGDEYRRRLADMTASFRQRIDALPASVQDDTGLQAVKAFLNDPPIADLERQPAWPEIVASNPIVSFRLHRDHDLVCARSRVAEAALNVTPSEDDTAAEADASDLAMCLVTGETAPIERLHAAIKGVWGAQTSGANIISFNLDAFNSYGKSQGDNAPVSRAASFAYTTALNHLLDRNSGQRLQIGDASTVFWAQTADGVELEEAFAEAYQDYDDPDAHAEKMRALLQAIRSGRFDGGGGEELFFVLGLAPNAARISVRFWHAATFSEVARNTRQWFEDLQIDRAPGDHEFPSLYRLLLSAAVLGKADNIPSHLDADLMRSALAGGPLPWALLRLVVQRCVAEQTKTSDTTGRSAPNVTYYRAVLLKAGINRLIRKGDGSCNAKEIDVSLDTSNQDSAYLFGRLFAAYEQIQRDAAQRDVNRSVRDSFFGAAMSNPASVFPRLIQLNQHHMKDLRRQPNGLYKVRDKLLLEIWDKLDPKETWPTTQPLPRRALFALGYYHQRQDFFKGKAADATSTTTTTEESQPQ